jgi:hypothetical protein
MIGVISVEVVRRAETIRSRSRPCRQTDGTACRRLDPDIETTVSKLEKLARLRDTVAQ